MLLGWSFSEVLLSIQHAWIKTSCVTLAVIRKDIIGVALLSSLSAPDNCPLTLIKHRDVDIFLLVAASLGDYCSTIIMMPEKRAEAAVNHIHEKRPISKQTSDGIKIDCVLDPMRTLTRDL